jgi:hypothetical protein
MIHDAESHSAEFEQGRLMGEQEERARIIKLFHDEVSSPMMAALFCGRGGKKRVRRTKPSRGSGAGKSLGAAYRGC